jgi:hypothetical protein
VVVGPHREHQLQALGDGGDGGREGPAVERGRSGALDVVEVELGDEREVIAERLGAHGEVAHVVPGGRHVLVLDIAQPAAEDWHPESEAEAFRPLG